MSIISHKVICSVCRESFDRDKEPYAISGSRRYAHKDCWLGINPEGQIIYPNDEVECCFCGKPFKKSITEYVQVGKKFAHKECEAAQQAVKDDKQILDNYINNLFKTEFVPPSIQKQIKDYIARYNYTYEGILQTLKYFYEVKKRSLPNTTTLGIIPYVYADAQAYFGKLQTIKEANENIDIKKADKEVVYIRRPRRKINKKRFFTFLDFEEE